MYCDIQLFGIVFNSVMVCLTVFNCVLLISIYLASDIYLYLPLSIIYSRIALVGPNGCGKSTLLNLIQSKILPTTGDVKVSGHLRLSVFTQHHLDSFDLNSSPLQNLFNRYPGASEPALRAHLGRYEIQGNDALKPMKFSSGGQKSRVAFAAMTFNKPHVVILGMLCLVLGVMLCMYIYVCTISISL